MSELSNQLQSRFVGLEQIIHELEDLRRAVRFNLKHAVPGTLMISKLEKQPMRFLQVVYEDGVRRTSYIARNPGLIYRLAYQKVQQELLKRIDYNLKLYEIIRDREKPIDLTSIMKDLPKNYEVLDQTLILNPAHVQKTKRMPQPSRDQQIYPLKLKLKMDDMVDQYQRLFAGEQRERQYFYDNWDILPYCENTSHLEFKTQVAFNGLFARSKSEVALMALYDQKKIRIHYDEVVYAGGEILSPDFIGMKADGTIVLHEHVGRMDDEMYRERFYKKIYSYRLAGFYPGKNLFFTYDDKDGNIDLELASKKIDEMYK